MIYALIGLVLLANLLFFLLFSSFRKLNDLRVVNARLRAEIANLRQNELVLDLMLAEYVLPLKDANAIQRLQYILTEYNKTLIRTEPFNIVVDESNSKDFNTKALENAVDEILLNKLNKTFSHAKYSHHEPNGSTKVSNESVEGNRVEGAKGPAKDS